ncbi:MAG: hypothetical protein ACREEM_22450 [Blastocatellia bacterium]
MKRFTFLTLTLMALLFASAFAAPAVRAQEQKSKIPALIAQLDLSEDQKKKLEPIYEEQAKQVKSLKENTALSVEEREVRMKEINQSSNKQLNQVLTSGQRDKLKELRRQRQQQRKPEKP